MKKITLLGILLFTGIAVSAQTDPFEQYLFKTYFPSLVTYDSISVSSDTGANFSATETASMHYMSQDNSRIDTCNITDMGSLSEVYKGFYNNGTYELAAFDPSMGTSDTILKYVFHKNISGRDSIIEIFEMDNPPSLVGALGIQYNASNEIDRMYLMADQFGTGTLDTMLRFEYFYSTNHGPDSLYQVVDVMGFTQTAKILFHYQGNALLFAEAFSDTSDIMNPPSYALENLIYFKHNSQDEIVEIHDYEVTSTDTILWGAYRYDIRVNSTIGLKSGSSVAFNLYPNPADHFLKIDAQEPIGKFEILSVTGQLVKTGEVMGSEINIRELKTGSYLLRLEVDGQYESLSFQKK